MKFFVTSESNNYNSSSKQIAGEFASRPEAQAFIDASEYASEYQIEEHETKADCLGEESDNGYAAFQREQYAIHEADLKKAEVADMVNKWLAQNTDRLDYAYDDNNAFLAWKKEAIAYAIANPDAEMNEEFERMATEAELNADLDKANYLLGVAGVDVAQLRRLILNNPGQVSIEVNEDGDFNLFDPHQLSSYTAPRDVNGWTGYSLAE